jgi:hypothetical protein
MTYIYLEILPMRNYSKNLPSDKNKNSNILKIETSPYSSAVRASGLGCPNPGFLL